MTKNEMDEKTSREGFDSSNNGNQGGEKKKRMRVGDLRKQSYNSTAEMNSRGERNPYQSGNDRGGSSSYNDRPRSSQYGSTNRDGGYNRDNRDSGGYNRDNNRSDYNRDNRSSGSSYQSNSYNREGGYNNSGYSNRDNNYSRDNNYNRDNRQGGYNDDRRSYGNNNNRGGGYNNDRQQGGQRSNNYGGGQGNRGGFNKAAQTPRGGNFAAAGEKKLIKPVKYKENVDPSVPLRLNKYLANAGVCSRREADSYITAGVVKVNGEVVDQLGAKVTRADLVTFHDQPVRLESKVYVLLNKPKNCVTTSDDPQNRVTVMDLVKNACPERIYPVGRLDRNTTGVLLLTNDGDLASKLTHPKFMKKKIYQVTLDRDVAIEDMQAIADGVELDDGEIHADSIAYQAEDVLNVVGIEIHSGRNRIVRRIFEKLGYQVVKLDRVYFAGLTKKNVQRGKWRYLSEKEVNMLRMGAFE